MENNIVEMPQNKKSLSASELRQDLVSGDWVAVATGRAKRPHAFIEKKKSPFNQTKSECPFEKVDTRHALLVYGREFNPEDRGFTPRSEAPRKGEAVVEQSVGRGKPLAGDSPSEIDWWVAAIANRYPAFGSGTCAVFYDVGPYQWTQGVGFHEVVVTRDHTRSIAMMRHDEVEQILRVYQGRVRVMREDDCVKYISIFHNHGRAAGASISHPHSQIIALPVIPPDVGRSIKGSSDYFHRFNACVHCAIVGYELEAGDRIVYENDHCIVHTPFASKTAFEMRIFPKKHRARFEDAVADERASLADALRVALAKLFHGLKNPDYNFFFHTAPVGKGKESDHYHWHVEILPKTAIWAGFEIGTGIEISTITPEAAAAFLRKVPV